MRETRPRAPLTAGMTLTEVLIAVSIVAILASLALPQYRKKLEVNYRQQAQDLLTTIYYGERAFRWMYRVNGRPKWKSALTPFKGSNTQSPYITLATRA